jgi:hypothetical protein
MPTLPENRSASDLLAKTAARLPGGRHHAYASMTWLLYASLLLGDRDDKLQLLEEMEAPFRSGPRENRPLTAI